MRSILDISEDIGPSEWSSRVDFDWEGSPKNHYDDFFGAIDRAVEKRASPPAWLSLSSGIDSGVIAASLCKQKINTVHVLSFIGEEDRHVIRERHDKLALAGMDAQTYEPSIAEVQSLTDTFFEEVPDRQYASAGGSEYFSVHRDFGAFGHYLMSRHAGRLQKNPACLTGFFGDGIFGNGITKYPYQFRHGIPWGNLDGETVRNSLSVLTSVAGAVGQGLRHVLLDRDVIQEFIWLDESLKNQRVKQPLVAYLQDSRFPYTTTKTKYSYLTNNREWCRSHWRLEYNQRRGANRRSDVGGIERIVRDRGIERIVHFHADHWEMEWWADNCTEDTMGQYLDRMGESKLSAFIRAPIRAMVDESAKGADGMYFEVAETAGMFKSGIEAIRERMGDVHIHMHHESWTRTEWPESRSTDHMKRVHRYACKHPQFDEIRFLTKLEMIRDFLGITGEWGFVHGCWALNGGDPEVCQLSNELHLLQSMGCLGDFSFPAGRRNCDPKIKVPYTVKPVNQIRGYDSQAADPITADQPEAWEPGRFLIWSCDRRSGWWSSLDYKSDRIRLALENPETAKDFLAMDAPVLNGTAYIKTHAHSMDSAYWQSGAVSPLEFGNKTILRRFREIADECGIAYVDSTASQVVEDLRIASEINEQIN